MYLYIFILHVYYRVWVCYQLSEANVIIHRVGVSIINSSMEVTYWEWKSNKTKVDLCVFFRTSVDWGLLLALYDPSSSYEKRKQLHVLKIPLFWTLTSYKNITIYNERIKSIYLSSVSIPRNGLDLFLSILQKLQQVKDWNKNNSRVWKYTLKETASNSQYFHPSALDLLCFGLKIQQYQNAELKNNI